MAEIEEIKVKRGSDKVRSVRVSENGLRGILWGLRWIHFCSSVTARYINTHLKLFNYLKCLFQQLEVTSRESFENDKLEDRKIASNTTVFCDNPTNHISRTWLGDPRISAEIPKCLKQFVQISRSEIGLEKEGCFQMFDVPMVPINLHVFSCKLQSPFPLPTL